MMDDPTRGIDVGAKYEIYELIINMAKQGKTIIVVSSEMPEILGITNRIGVMSVSYTHLMQYAIEDGKVFVIEANPRASRTVPLVSKVCGINMVQIATDIVTLPYTGRKSPVPELKEKKFAHYGVKEAVFPFNMFPEVDPVLGPEMRSTGEVLGLSTDFGDAFFKAEEATKTKLPTSGCVLISVNDRDKAEVVDVARGFYQLGFEIMATGRTCDLIEQAGIPALKVCKLNEGRPNILDKICLLYTSNPSADLSGGPGGIDACGTIFESSAAALGRGKGLSDAAEYYA